MRIMGFELTRTPSQSAFLRSRSVDLVLDVGANRGQYAKGLRKEGYRGRIQSFEPVSTVFAKLQTASARDANWHARHCAVGENAGIAEINVSKNTVYSSIRQQTTMSAEFSYKSAVVATESVAVISLDAIMSEPQNIGYQNIFLKIDTQGYEKDVLLGAVNVLKRCVGIQLELPVEHLYQDVWSFNDALLHMEALGFVPAQFRMVNPLHDDPASGIEFDCIFRQKRQSS